MRLNCNTLKQTYFDLHYSSSRFLNKFLVSSTKGGNMILMSVFISVFMRMDIVF